MNNYWIRTALFLSGENRSALEIVIDSPNLRKFFHFIIGFDSPKLRLHYRTLNRKSVQIRFDLKLKLNIRNKSWIVSFLCVFACGQDLMFLNLCVCVWVWVYPCLCHSLFLPPPLCLFTHLCTCIWVCVCSYECRCVCVKIFVAYSTRIYWRKCFMTFSK